MTEDSYIKVAPSHTLFAGRDAIQLYRATMLRSAIKLATKRIQITRGLTMTKALAYASEYTGQKYKRTEAERAITDLTAWIETMKSALPITHEN